MLISGKSILLAYELMSHVVEKLGQTCEHDDSNYPICSKKPK